MKNIFFNDQVSHLQIFSAPSVLPDQIVHCYSRCYKRTSSSLSPTPLSTSSVDPIDHPLLTSLPHSLFTSLQLQQRPPVQTQAISARKPGRLPTDLLSTLCVFLQTQSLSLLPRASIHHQLQPHFLPAHVSQGTHRMSLPNLPPNKSSLHPSLQHLQPFPVNTVAEQASKTGNVQLSHLSKIQRSNKTKTKTLHNTHLTKANPEVSTQTYNYPKPRYLDTSQHKNIINNSQHNTSPLEHSYPTISGTYYSSIIEAQDKDLTRNHVQTIKVLKEEINDLSQWELTDSGLKAGNLHRTKLGPLNMGDSCVAWAICAATGSGTRIYYQCLNWLFGAHSFQSDALLSLDIVGRALVLLQTDVSDFVDSPWKALSSLRSGQGQGGGWWGRVEEGEGMGTGIAM